MVLHCGVGIFPKIQFPILNLPRICHYSTSSDSSDKQPEIPFNPPPPHAYRSLSFAASSHWSSLPPLPNGSLGADARGQLYTQAASSCTHLTGMPDDSSSLPTARNILVHLLAPLQALPAPKTACSAAHLSPPDVASLRKGAAVLRHW